MCRIGHVLDLRRGLTSIINGDPSLLVIFVQEDPNEFLCEKITFDWTGFTGGKSIVLIEIKTSKIDWLLKLGVWMTLERCSELI